LRCAQGAQFVVGGLRIPVVVHHTFAGSAARGIVPAPGR